MNLYFFLCLLFFFLIFFLLSFMSLLFSFHEHHIPSYLHIFLFCYFLTQSLPPAIFFCQFFLFSFFSISFVLLNLFLLFNYCFHIFESSHLQLSLLLFHLPFPVFSFITWEVSLVLSIFISYYSFLCFQLFSIHKSSGFKTFPFFSCFSFAVYILKKSFSTFFKSFFFSYSSFTFSFQISLSFFHALCLSPLMILLL